LRCIKARTWTLSVFAVGPVTLLLLLLLLLLPSPLLPPLLPPVLHSILPVVLWASRRAFFLVGMGSVIMRSSA
jgi:hypothetical protein